MLFCDRGDIIQIVITIAGSIWLIKHSDGFIGGFLFFGVIIYYVKAVIGEFNAGHIVHGLISVMIIVVPVSLAIVVHIKNEKVRKAEISLIPDRVEKYISTHGYTSANDFIKYSNENPEFAKARKVQYTNPLYTKQVAENKKREQNKQKPLPITEPSEINYGQFASFKYKEIVLTYFMKELPDVLKNIYMFDYADIYVNMPNYSDFFQIGKSSDIQEEISMIDSYDYLMSKYSNVDKTYFQQACIGIINQLIADNIIGRVGSSDLFRSKIIPESNGNIVEGETIEISFDD